jgi:16S rRNA G527 N7-methylase RsmG
MSHSLEYHSIVMCSILNVKGKAMLDVGSGKGIYRYLIW